MGVAQEAFVMETSPSPSHTLVSSGRVSEAHTDSSAGRRSADKKERRERIGRL